MLIARIVAVAAVAATAGTATAVAGVPPVKPGTDTSTNWAGYAVTDTVAAPVSFTAATATWRQPTLKCGAANARSAIWVGLGGVNSASGRLGQIGTRADCTGGKSRHHAFYEVTPAAGVPVHRFRISAGDIIAATVTVESERRIHFRIENLTTQRGFTVSLPMSPGLRRSAEWIIEAPTGCVGRVCAQADLANFGSVSFSRIAMVGNRHQGSILDQNWDATAVGLKPSRGQIAATGRSHGAVPSALTAQGSSFTVVWRRNASAPLPAPKPVPVTPVGPYVAGPRQPGPGG